MYKDILIKQFSRLLLSYNVNGINYYSNIIELGLKKVSFRHVCGSVFTIHIILNCFFFFLNKYRL